MPKTKLFTLGGMQEIGKTAIIIEHGDEIVIIDAGIKFTNSVDTGVEGIIPDFTYLKENEHKIKGLFITHGHEDHIGAVPYLIQQVKLPKIYAPGLAIAYINYKIKDKGIKTDVEIEEITSEKVYQFENMRVDFWTSQHSIPDSFGIRVTTPNGSIFDTGDFRFDYTPVGRNLSDFGKLEQIKNEGLDVLISDSTNSMTPAHSPSEQEILNDTERFIRDAKGKVIFTTFASNVNRIEVAINLAAKHNRKVVFFGRSMVNAIEIAQKRKSLNISPDIFVDKKNASSIPDNELLILSTGSQGEELAALYRMATDQHPYIKLRPGDVVIFSSSPIPGNRMKIEQLINNLYKVGAEIKENRIDGMLHTSGHAYHDEHAIMFRALQPRWFVPYHGAYRQSAVHGQTGIECGVKKENVIIIKNGEVLELDNHILRKTDQFIDPGPIYIDGVNATRETSEAISQREKLASSGFINVIIIWNQKLNELVGKTKIISRGAIFTKDSRELINEIQKMAHGTALFTIKNNPNCTKSDIKLAIQKRIEPFFFQEKRRRPVILTSIIDDARKDAEKTRRFPQDSDRPNNKTKDKPVKPNVNLQNNENKNFKNNQGKRVNNNNGGNVKRFNKPPVKKISPDLGDKTN